MKKFLKPRNILIAVFTALVLGSICRLSIFYSVVIGCMVYIFSLVVTKYMMREKESYFRYTQACLYMEQMENSFKRKRRIYQALTETLTLFSDGDMKDTVQDAINEIHEETISADAAEKALHIIEDKYGCEQMEMMHSFFLRSQEQGGDVVQAVKILQKRRNTWMDSVENCRAEKKKMLNSVFITLATLFFISELMILFLPPEMSIVDYAMEQILVVIEIFIFLLTARAVLKKNSADWLIGVNEREEEAIEKDYRFIEEYDPVKEMWTSIKWAVIPLVLTILISLATKSIIVLSIGAAVTVLMLNQHKMEYSLKKKKIEKEIERDFPRWMYNVILLLRTQSVQMAMEISLNKAPASLKYPLRNVCDELRKNPTNSEPYFSFLEEYDVPKVHESMKLLYSISSGTGGDIDEQMLNVIEKNNDMTLRSEKIKNDNKVAEMMLYMFMPVIPVGVKMMADLALILLAVSGSFGSVF